MHADIGWKRGDPQEVGFITGNHSGLGREKSS